MNMKSFQQVTIDADFCVVGGGMIYNAYMKSRMLALPNDKARIVYPEKEQIYGALKLALELSKE